MYLFHKPDQAAIEEFLSSQAKSAFTYANVGASMRDAPPAGYNVNRKRVRIGAGRELYDAAREALKRWAMFDTEWTALHPDRAPIRKGQVVCTLAKHPGFWSLNACRIVGTFDTGESASGPARFGLAFGTLEAHAVQGEERFQVEYHPEDQSVWFEQFAFSRPRDPLARVGLLYVRELQKRFGRDCCAAMVRESTALLAEQALRQTGAGTTQEGQQTMPEAYDPFGMMAATQVEERLAGLGRFLDRYYGPRQESYGDEPEQIEAIAMPAPLRQFYRMAGKRPPGNPGYTLEDTFYSGAAMHHLYTLDSLRKDREERLEFYGAYQGEWTGYTLLEGDDPPVWIEGYLDSGSGIMQASDSLSRFLVTHCLLATLYEPDNMPGDVRFAEKGSALAAWLNRYADEHVVIWNADEIRCDPFPGEYSLFREHILVRRVSDRFELRGIDAEGARMLEAQ